MNITAVKNKLNNILETVFWEKGQYDKFRVDNPCTIIFYENKNEFYVSSPNQKIENINVNIGENNYKVKVKNGYTYKIKIDNYQKFLNFSKYYIIILSLIFLFE